MQLNNYKSLAFTGIIIGTAANMIMQTVVAAILPQIMYELGGWHLYSWVFSGFLLAATITIPFFAKLADVYGYKRIYTFGMITFLLGSLLSGSAHSIYVLIAGRIIQGLGVGALGPVTIALISNLFNLKQRGRAMGIYAAAQLLSNVIGPIFGGMVAADFGWQWSFYMVIPIGFISLVFIHISLKNLADNRESISIRQLDLIGAFLLGASVTLLINGFNRLGHRGFEKGSILFIIISLVLLLIFIFQEKKHINPIISPNLITTRNIWLANISGFLVGLLMYGAIAVLPLYSEKILGNSPIRGSKLLIPLMVGLGLGIIVSGNVIKKFSYKGIAVAGWLISLTSLLILSLISFININNILIVISIFTAGIGIGSLLPTFLLPAQNAAPRESTGNGWWHAPTKS